MQFIKKLIQFFKSWRYLDLNENSSTVLMGYQGEDLLKYFDIEKENFDTSVKFITKDTIAKTIVAIDEYRNEGLTIFEASIRTKKYLKLIYKNEFANYAAPKAWQ